MYIQFILHTFSDVLQRNEISHCYNRDIVKHTSISRFYCSKFGLLLHDNILGRGCKSVNKISLQILYRYLLVYMYSANCNGQNRFIANLDFELKCNRPIMTHIISDSNVRTGMNKKYCKKKLVGTPQNTFVHSCSSNFCMSLHLWDKGDATPSTLQQILFATISFRRHCEIGWDKVPTQNAKKAARIVEHKINRTCLIEMV